MPNGEIARPVVRANIMAERLGPILDPAFLKIIPKAKMKEIVVVQMQAHSRALREELRATDAIAKIIGEMPVR